MHAVCQMICVVVFFVIPVLMPDCIMVIAACTKARVLPCLAVSVLGAHVMASC